MPNLHSAANIIPQKHHYYIRAHVILTVSQKHKKFADVLAAET